MRIEAFNLVAGAAIGAATGGQAGAVTGANIDWNNRQLHQTEIDLIEESAKSYAEKYGISEAQAKKELFALALMQVDEKSSEILEGSLSENEESRAKSWLVGLGEGNKIGNSSQTLFTATMPTRPDDIMNSQYANSFTNIAHMSNSDVFKYLGEDGNKLRNVLAVTAAVHSSAYTSAGQSTKLITSQYGANSAGVQALASDAKALLGEMISVYKANEQSLNTLKIANPSLTNEQLMNTSAYQSMQKIQSALAYTSNVINEQDYVQPTLANDPEYQRLKTATTFIALSTGYAVGSNRGAGNAAKGMNSGRKPTQVKPSADGDGRTVKIGQYTIRENGSVVNEKGTKFKMVGFDTDSKVVYAYDSNKSSYIRINQDGSMDSLTSAQVPNKVINSSPSTIRQNYERHAAAVNDSVGQFRSQGITVTTEVTLKNADNLSETARIDSVIRGNNGAQVNVPSGYVATDLNGNVVNKIQLDSEGYAGIEVKTGGATLERNQGTVYNSCANGCAISVGENAAQTELPKGTTPTEIYILRPMETK